jgi:hypothetical protein
MAIKEIVVRGDAPSEHVIQLFDTPETRAQAVAAFLSEGYHNGETLFVAISQQNWERVADGLRGAGVPVDAALASADMIVCDASVTLEKVRHNGRLDPDLFEASVAAAVRRLAASGKPFRVYGELVDLLAAEGEFPSVQLLEDLWNDLCDEFEFALFCGYSAANFGDPRSAESLRAICRSHSLVRANSRDLLGSFLATAAAGALKPVD